jgi:hypothetical protein
MLTIFARLHFIPGNAIVVVKIAVILTSEKMEQPNTGTSNSLFIALIPRLTINNIFQIHSQNVRTHASPKYKASLYFTAASMKAFYIKPLLSSF